MIRGDYIDLTQDELNHILDYSELEVTDKNMTLMWSDYFRGLCIKEGFELAYLYPCYHQGWEDEWGAIGTREGMNYRLETNHGRLEVSEL